MCAEDEAVPVGTSTVVSDVVKTPTYEIWENNYHGNTSELIYSTKSFALATFIMKALHIISPSRWGLVSVR